MLKCSHVLLSGFQREEAAPQYLPLHRRQGPQGVCGEPPFYSKNTQRQFLPTCQCHRSLYPIFNTCFFTVGGILPVHVCVYYGFVLTSLWGLWLVGWSGGGAVRAELFSRGGDAECGVHKGDGEVGIAACIPLPHRLHITEVKILRTCSWCRPVSLKYSV